MKRINFLMIGLIGALVLFASGCPTTKKIKEEEMNTRLVLEGNMTTGYEWAYKIQDESLLKIQHSTKYLGEQNVVGAGELNYFDFIPLAKGSTKVQFWYSRQWEDIPPAVVLWYEVKIDQENDGTLVLSYKEISNQ